METEVTTTFRDFVESIISEISFIKNEAQKVLDELKSAQYVSEDGQQIASTMETYQKRLESLIGDFAKITSDIENDAKRIEDGKC